MAPDSTLWIAKFPSRDDRRDVGGWEYLLTTLAQQVGINVPRTKRLKLSAAGSTFAAQRFDRDGTARRLFASAMTFVGRKDREEASYLDIATAVADYVEPTAIPTDLEQLFRRLVFNILVGNRDDHLRNHGFLHSANGWRLGPAFDMNPSPESSEHSLAIDDSSHEPDIVLAMETARFYRLTESRAEQIVAEMSASLSDWAELANEMGLSAEEIDIVGSAFSPTLRPNS